jgi:hypothetical protein
MVRLDKDVSARYDNSLRRSQRESTQVSDQSHTAILNTIKM